MRNFLLSLVLPIVFGPTFAFALSPEQQNAFNLVDQLSQRVFAALALSNPAAKQAEFCSMAQNLDYNNATTQLVSSWADRYSKTAEGQAQKDQDVAQFRVLLPSVISNDMLSLFETLNLVGGSYNIDPRPIPKGSRAVGVKANYTDAGGKSYEIIFTVSAVPGQSAKLIDAAASIASLVGSKQADYDKRMRDAYSNGTGTKDGRPTGYPIGALNNQLENELKFRCQ